MVGILHREALDLPISKAGKWRNRAHTPSTTPGKELLNEFSSLPSTSVRSVRFPFPVGPFQNFNTFEARMSGSVLHKAGVATVQVCAGAQRPAGRLPFGTLQSQRPKSRAAVGTMPETDPIHFPPSPHFSKHRPIEHPMTTPQSLETSNWRRSTMLANILLLSAAFLLSAFAAFAIPSDASSNAPIAWADLGAKATAQYTGDGLGVVRGEDGVVRLRCSFQKLDGVATAEGLWLGSTVPGAAAFPSGGCRVLATAVGREGGAVGELPRVGVVGGDAAVARFVRPGLTEEYSVSVDGLRQDFVVAEAPGGSGDLRVEMALSGARGTRVGSGVELVLDGSGRKLAYSRLKVLDATGRELAARLEVRDQDRLAVVVADAGATYPLRIDPTFSDANWVSMGAGGLGADSAIYTTVVDGSGNVYVSGYFTQIGSVLANGIAKWDGTNWSALGSGGTGIAAMAVSGTTVYVGGNFGTMGGTAAWYIAKWDGTNWSAFPTPAVGGYVYALAVSGTNLYVGGAFTYAGGLPMNHIARWDGSTWSALGAGVNDTVFGFAFSGSTLYVGGNFTTAGGAAANRMASWNGSTWSPLGSGMDAVVWTLAVSGANLYAGGQFTTAGGSAAKYVAKWNGSAWSSLGSGMNDYVAALAVFGGDLYAGGKFTFAGGTLVGCIAKWNGTTWSAVGVGMDYYVNAFAVFGTNLYAGGSFTKADGASAKYLARWDGNSWSTPGAWMNGTVWSVAVMDTNIYVGGSFTMAGGKLANRVACWDGNSWSTLGSGMNNLVRTLAVSGTNLYAGGTFTMAGGAVANYAACWNGSTWSPLGTGFDLHVYALAASGTNLYAGGAFRTAGGTAATYIAKWNGSTWSAVGGGLSSYVYSIVASDTTLYAGGNFSAAGGVAVNCVARWDGTSWSPLGSGLDSTVMSLALSGTTLYAGGNFTTAGGAAANYVAKWNGSTWSPLGTGLNAYVRALVVRGSTVYAGGNFTTAGGSAAKYMAVWNGTAWSPLGSGVDSTVYAMGVVDPELYVGGDFTTAGGKNSSFAAKFVMPPPDVITTTTLGVAPNPSTYGDSVTLTATLSTNTATGTVTFQDGATVLGTVTVSESVATFTTNGLTAATHLLTASYSGTEGYAPSTSSTITQVVNQASATVSLGSLSQTYNGTSRVATATTLPVGLPVTFSYDASAVAPLNAGSYVVIGTVGNTNYTGAATNTLVVARATPSVTTWPIASTILQGQALSTSSLSGESTTVAGSFAFTVPATLPILGTSAQAVIFTPTSSTNYNSVTGSVSVVAITAPTATTLAATSVLGSSAVLNASINPGAAASLAFFQFATGSNTVVSTLAGSGPAGYADGISTVAQFSGPYGVAVDRAGNVYISELDNHRIRKVTSEGVVTTLAGSGVATFSEGTGVSASFSYPKGVAVDGEGNVYVADMMNCRIRKITSAGVVTTLAGSSVGFADGTGAAARFNFPNGIALDAATNLYVTDGNNHAIRKITPAGVVSTLAGGTQGIADGTGAAAQFDHPMGIAVDAATNVYVYSKNRIRKVTPAGVVTTLAGSGTVASIDGTGAAASFNGVLPESSGDFQLAGVVDV